jgi:hypothetical protein
LVEDGVSQAFLRVWWLPARLEFVADTGAATTEPLRLYSEALTWLQGASFDLARRVTTH